MGYEMALLLIIKDFSCRESYYNIKYYYFSIKLELYFPLFFSLRMKSNPHPKQGIDAKIF